MRTEYSINTSRHAEAGGLPPRVGESAARLLPGFERAAAGPDPSPQFLGQPPKREVRASASPAQGQSVSLGQAGPRGARPGIVEWLRRTTARSHPFEQDEEASVAEDSHKLGQQGLLAIGGVVMNHRHRPHEIKDPVSVRNNEAVRFAQLDIGMLAPGNLKHAR